MRIRAFPRTLYAVPMALALAGAASAGPPAPTAVQLSRMRLGDGFTLVYQVTTHDLRPQALRERQVAAARQATGEALAAARMPKNMAGYYERQNADLARLRPDEHFTVTLSARAGRLLYLSTRGSKSGKEGVKKDGTMGAIVLDGDKEYGAIGTTAAEINNDAWRTAPVYRGENVDRLAFCPLPGVGLPGVDLIQSPVRAGATPDGHARFTGLVPRLNLMDGDSPYKVGAVEAVLRQGRLRVVSLTVGPPAAPEQAWKITAFRLVQGHWTGTAMQMTSYEAGVPTSEANYHLLDTRPASLDAEAFELDTYLTKGASVFDNSTGNSFSFKYDPDDGSLREQAIAARASKKESPALDSGPHRCHTTPRCQAKAPVTRGGPRNAVGEAENISKESFQTP